MMRNLLSQEFKVGPTILKSLSKEGVERLSRVTLNYCEGSHEIGRDYGQTTKGVGFCDGLIKKGAVFHR